MQIALDVWLVQSLLMMPAFLKEEVAFAALDAHLGSHQVYLTSIVKIVREERILEQLEVAFASNASMVLSR